MSEDLILGLFGLLSVGVMVWALIDIVTVRKGDKERIENMRRDSERLEMIRNRRRSDDYLY